MPRLGLATIDISTLAGSGGAVTGIDDFVFESFTAGQMHPIQTVDRENLVLQSETWDNASWTKNASTVEPNQIASPLDSSAFTADLLKEDNANAEHWVRSNNISASLGQTFTMSFYAKAKERTFIKANFLNSGLVSYNVWINLSNGAITSKNANLTVTTELIGSGFYRITLTAQAAATTLNLLVALATGDANNSYAGDGSSGVYVFGAQIEQDNFVGNYIPTVGSTVTVSTTLNDTSNVWDFDGTDIMIAEDPEDEGFWEESYPEGASLPELVLNGDYADLGSELVENGTFDADSNWEKDANWSIANGKATSTGSGRMYQSIPELESNVGTVVQVTFNIVERESGGVVVNCYGGVSSEFNTVGAHSFVTTTTNSLNLYFNNSGAGNLVGSIDNVSVKEVDPNNRWVSEADWTIKDGVAKGNGASGSSEELRQDGILTVGDTYEFTFTIQDYSSGSVELINNGLGSLSSNGTHTGIGVATSTDLRFRGSSFNGSIDNVSVREYAIQPLDI